MWVMASALLCLCHACTTSILLTVLLRANMPNAPINILISKYNDKDVLLLLIYMQLARVHLKKVCARSTATLQQDTCV